MSNIFEKAILYSFNKHEGQIRKNGEIYILHPLEAATIVGTMTSDLEILAASVLHDVVEDSNVAIEEIKEEFGSRVEKLVSSETESKFPQMNRTASWEMRKQESIQTLKNTADIAVKMIWLGDKLSNMRSIARDYEKIGTKLFERFNEKNPAKHCWYYYEVLKNIEELKEYPVYKEYENLLNQVFGEYRKENNYGKNN